MISFNTVTSALGLTTPARTSPSRASGTEKPAQTPQDGASLSEAARTTPSVVSTDLKESRPARLGETGRESALQALPGEGQVARLLDSKAAAMTEEQRTACIADLETLNLAGRLKTFDPLVSDYTLCGVAKALDLMTEGTPIFYSGSGRQANQLIQISDLEKLSQTATEASFGIIR